MGQRTNRSRSAASLALLGLAFAAVMPARGQVTLNTLVAFPVGYTSDGPVPFFDAPVPDDQGNLYFEASDIGVDYGSILKISAGTHAVTTVATFNNSNGDLPLGGLTIDASGNLYGTTAEGGNLSVPGTGGQGAGTVFEIPAGTQNITTLATFNTSTAGDPRSGVSLDAKGNLYGGTTGYSGSADAVLSVPSVFEVAAGSGSVTTLVTLPFNPTTNLPYQSASVISDAAGNLYGTTSGTGGTVDGTVFKVSAGTSTVKTLAAFSGYDGALPWDGLFLDPAGNVFGATAGDSVNNQGTVFEIRAGENWAATLATFDLSRDQGSIPNRVIEDAAGNLYGMTWTSGPSRGEGTVFKISAGSGTITTLYTFSGIDGAYPTGGLVADAQGNLYGLTAGDGVNNDGTVFELSGSGFVVPEPDSIAMIGLAGFGMLAHRKWPMPHGRRHGS